MLINLDAHVQYVKLKVGAGLGLVTLHISNAQGYEDATTSV